MESDIWFPQWEASSKGGDSQDGLYSVRVYAVD